MVILFQYTPHIARNRKSNMPMETTPLPIIVYYCTISQTLIYMCVYIYICENSCCRCDFQRVDSNRTLFFCERFSLDLETKKSYHHSIPCWIIMFTIQIAIMWEKQCHKPPMIGGDDWGMVSMIVLPTLYSMSRQTRTSMRLAIYAIISLHIPP